MNNYILAIHHYWMDSKHFSYKEVECKDIHAAESKASEIIGNNVSLFNNCDVLVIPIREKQTTRKLSFMERLTGRLKNE